MFNSIIAKFCTNTSNIIKSIVKLLQRVANKSRFYPKHYITPNGIYVTKYNVIVPDPDGRFRTLTKEGIDIPPKNIEYWKGKDFDKFYYDKAYRHIVTIYNNYNPTTVHNIMQAYGEIRARKNR